MKKRFNLLVLAIVTFLAVGSAQAQVIIADHFDMDHDWSGDTAASLKGITSTDPSGNSWGNIGVNQPAVIDQASGHTGRGLKFTLAPGTGAAAIGCEMSGYPQTAWQGRSQFIGYYSKISDNTNWGSKGNTLKMLRVNMEKNDVIPELVGGAYSMFIGTSNVFNGIYTPDTNWHKYLWELTAQSSPGAADGVIRLWVDDQVVFEKADVKWNSYGTIKNGTQFEYGFTTSWYYFFIQGNLMASYDGPTKYMYWDDFIIATTKPEVDAFIAAPAAVAKQQVPTNSAPDTIAPSEPNGLTATALSAKQIQLSWAPSVDNVAVTGYKVYRNGSFYKSVTGTTMTDADLLPSTQYSYTVSAVDAAGNASGQSAPATALTEYAPLP